LIANIGIFLRRSKPVYRVGVRNRAMIIRIDQTMFRKVVINRMILVDNISRLILIDNVNRIMGILVRKSNRILIRRINRFLRKWSKWSQS